MPLSRIARAWTGVLARWRRRSAEAEGPGAAPDTAVAGNLAAVHARRAASAVVPAESLWSEAFVHNDHGMAITDPVSSTLVTVNPAYAHLVGRTPGQLEGEPMLRVYPVAEHVQLAVAEHTADLKGSATLQT